MIWDILLFLYRFIFLGIILSGVMMLIAAACLDIWITPKPKIDWTKIKLSKKWIDITPCGIVGYVDKIICEDGEFHKTMRGDWINWLEYTGNEYNYYSVWEYLSGGGKDYLHYITTFSKSGDNSGTKANRGIRRN